MTGCVKSYVKPQLPSNLRSCDQLNVFNGTDFGDVVKSYLELVNQYKECSAKNEAKNSLFEKAPN